MKGKKGRIKRQKLHRQHHQQNRSQFLQRRHRSQIDTNSDGIYDITDIDPSGMPWPANVWLTDWQTTSNWVVAHYQAAYGIPYTSIRKKLPASSCNGPSCPAGSECCWWTDGGGSGNGGNIQYYRAQWEKISPPVCPAGYQYVSSDVMCYQDVIVRGNVDGCQSLAGDPLCRLKTETVDGVSTYANFSPTGLAPMSSCKTLTGKLQNYQECNSWWIKNRMYLCQTSSAYDLSAVKERARNINSTAVAGTGSVTYQDKTKNASGSWSYDSNTVTMNTTSGSGSCMTACKTRKPATNTQASLSGTTAQSNVSTDSWEFFYRTCNGANCPVGAGEELLIDCQCIDEFAEAATMMEVMNQSGKDLICSNGALQ